MIRNGSSFSKVASFEQMLPRSISAESYQTQARLDKTGATFTGLGNLGQLTGLVNGSNNMLRSPARRFYDPEVTCTAVYLPRTLKQVNRWCRWFADHDELVGAVLELHAELPYSKAEVMVEDRLIQRHTEDCFDRTHFFSMLPAIDLEFMKIGEVFIHDIWDDKEGMWSNIIIHNPDYIEVTFSPFADEECVIELIPDEELKSIIHSTSPEKQQLKRRLPKEIVRRVLTGKNILLDSKEVTHIARRSNPYDVRGTSIIRRLFRTLIYEDKLREAQITIADNFIYPLKIFKLGDPQKGWIPSAEHQMALAEMLQQAAFDPNFALIYHYGLQVDYVTLADKIMRLDPEWNEINSRKMVALGVSQQFMTGESTYATANVGLQTQLARYRAKRDLFEIKWVRDKFLRGMAERNEWYRRDAREILAQYRVKRTGVELSSRLIVPKLVWHKKLMMRDDQSFLTFMNNVYSQGKGPISAITMLQYMGLDLEDELTRKNMQRKLEEKIGEYIHPQAAAPAAPGMGLGLTAKWKTWRDKVAHNKEMKDLEGILLSREAEEVKASLNIADSADKEFIGFTDSSGLTYLSGDAAQKNEDEYIEKVSQEFQPCPQEQWMSNLRAVQIPSEVTLVFSNLDNLIKTKDNVTNIQMDEYKKELLNILNQLYLKGKYASYSRTNFNPIYRQYYVECANLTEYSDLVLSEEFTRWIDKVTASTKHSDSFTRNIALSAFAFGQLKGYQEQGVSNVKLSNVYKNDGIRYKISELLSKNSNLGFLISPEFEIPLFSPCIEGFDDEDFGTCIDSTINKYSDFSYNSLYITGCPIEYVKDFKRFLDKVGSSITRSYSRVSFVKDVIDLPEWEENQLLEIEKSYSSAEANTKKLLVNSTLSYAKMQKRGAVPYLSGKKRTLYLSTWLGNQPTSLTVSLITNLDFLFSNNFKQAKLSKIKLANYDLTSDEIDTYLTFGYIEPLFSDLDNPGGFKLSKKAALNLSGIDKKLIKGKVWSLSGKCGANVQDDFSFDTILRMYIDYPHLLSDDIKSIFDV